MLLLLFGVFALAREPTCAVLLCNETAHAAAWIEGAQDEFIVVLESVFGGFDAETGARIGGCFDKTTILNSLVCLDRDDFPSARCYAKYCDFWRHSELFEGSADHDDDDHGHGGCVAPSTEPHDRDHKQRRQQRTCRTLQAWAAIGVDKLYAAFDAFDAGNFTNATSYACVAEKLLRLVTARLPPVFDDGASYRHQVLPEKLAAFDMLSGSTSNATANNDTNDLLIGTRTVRSFRRAADASTPNHTLIATYILARVLERSIDEAATEQAEGGTTELLWPLSGSLAPFDKTALPPQALCAVADQPTNLAPFQTSRILPCLGPLDFAAVADEFARCRSFPSSRIRRYDDLSAASCCSTVVLIADIDDKATGTRIEPRRESLGYVAHFRSPCTFEAIIAAAANASNTTTTSPPPSNSTANSTTFDPQIEAELVARVAASDLCIDVPSVSMPDVSPSSNASNATSANGGNTTTSGFGGVARGWRPPREGVPITLAPGESRCVGGERAGGQCSMESECGVGRTCRVKPGSQRAFCYDRFAWSDDEPCIYADDATECPYGYCYGAADGHDGGAYPLLYAYREQNCGDRVRALDHEACPPEVINWFEHPKLDSVQ
jgi:hypothetical protein